jgi:hypothetical protein
MYNRYYVEYVFETKDKSRKYLFPIFITATTLDAANDLVKRTRIALSEHFNVLSNSFPRLLIPHFNSDYFKMIYDQAVTGRCARLNVREWVFNDFDPDPNLSFDQNLALMPYETNFDPTKIANTISKKEFPIRVIKDEFPFEGEFIVLDIVF